MNPETVGTTSAPTVHLLAHEGGWDEILLVALPLIAIAALLLVANRKISAKLAAEKSADPAPPDERRPDQNQA